jgi:hypothetical protein
MPWEKKKRRRKGEVSQLKQEIPALIRQLSQRRPGVYPEIWARWSDIVGGDLVRCTMPRSLKGGVLKVAVGGSSWMQELTYLAPKIMDKLAEEVGPDVVREIRFVLDWDLFKARRSEPPEPAVAQESDAPLPTEIASAIEGIEDEKLKDIVRRAAKANIKDP